MRELLICTLVLAVNTPDLAPEKRAAALRRLRELVPYRCCCSYPAGPHTLPCLNANKYAEPPERPRPDRLDGPTDRRPDGDW